MNSHYLLIKHFENEWKRILFDTYLQFGMSAEGNRVPVLKWLK